MIKNIYRVVMKSRHDSKKQSVAYSGDSASIATSTFEDLVKRPTVMQDFKIVLEVMKPETVWESE